jgi:hypothetical protein
MRRCRSDYANREAPSIDAHRGRKTLLNLLLKSLKMLSPGILFDVLSFVEGVGDKTSRDLRLLKVLLRLPMTTTPYLHGACPELEERGSDERVHGLVEDRQTPLSAYRALLGLRLPKAMGW